MRKNKLVQYSRWALALLALPSINLKADLVTSDEAPVVLDKTVVSESKLGAAPPTLGEAAQQLAEIAGGTSLIDANVLERSRASSTADILAFQPGVFAQAAGGNDSIKISVRGSSINRGTGFFRSGLLFTFDGLPVTGPSGTPFELFEPLGLNYVEVLRGANAFDRGALALGGAINYVSNTGYTAAPFEVRTEAGSFGYYKAQLSSGAVEGAFDYYTSVTGSSRDGFEDFSKSQSFRFSSNFGFRINANVETRLYIHYGYARFDQPGVLTRAQIESDPTQANALNVTQNVYRVQPGSTWIGSKTTIKLDADSSLEIGAVFHDFPIIIGGNTLSLWTYGNVAGSLKYSRTDFIGDRKSDTTVALYSSNDIYGSVRRLANLGGTQSYSAYAGSFAFGAPLTTNQFGGSADNVLLVSNDLQLLPKLTLTTGLAGTYIRRHIDITYPVNLVYNKANYNYEPRLGLRYIVAHEVELFGNLSRSIEPRNDWAGVNTPGISPGWFVRDLKDQTATAAEIGARAKLGIFQGSVSYYHTSVSNELLSVVVVQPNTSTETNASPTTHQGVEVALDTTLWQEGGNAAHRLVFHQAYTWNDFHYKNDPRFGSNRLPGVPPHFYQGELRYDHPTGLSISANIQAASRYPVDYANTYDTFGYAIYGARLGYAPPKGRWESYVELRNLTDKTYAADVSPGFNDLGKDIAHSDVGDGFGVFVGFTFHL